MPRKTKISPARLNALTVLENVLSQGETLLDALPILERKDSDPRDLALAREIASGTCRWLGRIHHALKNAAPRFDNFPPAVQRILELSVYQLHFLDRVPPYAVISDAVELTRVKRCPGLASAVNAILRTISKQSPDDSLPKRETDFVHYCATVHSHPKWLIERWLKIWSAEQVEALCKHNNTQAPLYLRVRGNVQEALDTLHDLEIQCKPDPRLPGSIKIEETNSIPPEVFESDRWIVQDGAQTLVGLLADPHPGWRIWDVCAAPGGKTFHLADLMNGEGTITATDKNASRLERLRERAVSLALSCVTAVPLDPLADAIPNDFMPFDAILVDAPCTGWGTFRRRPDLRWRLKTDDSRRSGKKALQLIERIYPSLKPGGVLIYSTCTLSPDENRQVVEEFLKNHNDCIIEPAQDFLPPQFAEAIDGRGFLDLFPAHWGLDGAFAARLKKRG